MAYFIRDKAQPDGPYDMMGIIRKIRNGAIRESTPMSNEAEGALKPAGDFVELQDFFKDSDPDDVVVSRSPAAQRKAPPSFTLLMSRQLSFLMQNLSIAIYSGVFMLVWLSLAYLIFSGDLISVCIGVVMSYFLLGGYFYGVHKYVRGNPLEVSDIKEVVVGNASQMLIAAVVFTLVMSPAIAAVMFCEQENMPVTLPFLFTLLLVTMTFFAYVPLLIVHKRLPALKAITVSLRAVMANKGESLGVVFGFTALNFLFLPFLPLVLPLTSCAIADLYDEYVG